MQLISGTGNEFCRPFMSIKDTINNVANFSIVCWRFYHSRATVTTQCTSLDRLIAVLGHCVALFRLLHFFINCLEDINTSNVDFLCFNYDA